MLVILAPTRTFHPAYDQAIIDQALEEDPEKAAAEYLCEWRKDLADYVRREVAEAAIIKSRAQLEPIAGYDYRAFCDPSGGSRDSMTLAIAHVDQGRGVLDCLLERRAPFNPDDPVAEFAATCRQYGISSMRGDRYGGDWVTASFANVGISYEPCERVKSDIYRDFLPLLNAGKTDLLDNVRMLNQLCTLERRTVRGGRDTVDHPQNGHDDLINAVAGIMVEILADPDGALWKPHELVNR